MERMVQPELLDSLPPDHPDALHNRRDLRLTNRLMGNHRWFARIMPSVLQPGELTLELGAGTGELGRRLSSLGVPTDGLDLWPSPPNWPADRTWHRSDLRTFEHFAPYSAVVGNLIFHQFSADELAGLGEKVRRSARVILASEPARRRLSQVSFRIAAPLLGVNHVSLHDAHVSIAAGFCGDELPRALRLEPEEWDFQCTATTLGAYRMIAVRRQ